MKETILSIADIPLKIEGQNQKLLPSFRAFNGQNKNLTHSLWHLESLSIAKNKFPKNIPAQVKNKVALIKERFRFCNQSPDGWEEKENGLLSLHLKYPQVLSHVSFYFNNPVEINIKEKKVKYFYFRDGIAEVERAFDNRLVSFAYSQILAINQGMLLHCAGVIKDANAYLFFAKPGGGKSTVAKLSRRYQVLGDDVIALRKNNKDFLAFSTPWKQKEFIKPKPSLAAKIKAAFFLKKAKYIYFKPLIPEETLVRVLSKHIHFFLYTERSLAEKIFFTATDFFKHIPAYEMYFTKKDNFWPMLEKII